MDCQKINLEKIVICINQHWGKASFKLKNNRKNFMVRFWGNLKVLKWKAMKILLKNLSLSMMKLWLLKKVREYQNKQQDN
jgi:hypothetical protein